VHEPLDSHGSRCSAASMTQLPMSNFVEHHIDAMSRQVLCKLSTRPPGVDSLFFSHGENTNAFRFLQNRHRICDSSRGRPTEIPTHDHGVESE
jgi:hypothetical protein